VETKRAILTGVGQGVNGRMRVGRRELRVGTEPVPPVVVASLDGLTNKTIANLEVGASSVVSLRNGWICVGSKVPNYEQVETTRGQRSTLPGTYSVVTFPVT
jgi:hypothetical protein